jgi:hypothetical protein
MAVHASLDSGIRDAPVIARTRSSFATRSQSGVGLSWKAVGEENDQSFPEFFDALVENCA